MDNLQALMARQPTLFASLLDEIRKAGTDNLSFFGNGYTHEGGLSLQQNPFEFAAAVVFLSEQILIGPKAPGSYLEIGSASGGACRFLCSHLRLSRAFVIDDHGHGRWTEQRANFDAMEAAEECRVEEWIGDSHSAEASEWLQKNVGGAPDLSFIDGDHSGPGCWADFEMVYKLLMNRNIMGPSRRLVMFHDTVACEGVKRSWEQACQSGMLTPLAEYIGPHERPLGIGIGRVG